MVGVSLVVGALSLSASAAEPSDARLVPRSADTVSPVTFSGNVSLVAEPNILDRYKHVYTSYLCLEGRNPARMAELENTGCGLDRSVEPDRDLAQQLQKMPSNYHLLVYGPSWIRQVADAIIRHEELQPGEKMTVAYHAENNPGEKTCYCTLRGTECPCADHATYHFPRGSRLTTVVNYGELQLPWTVHRLRTMLHNEEFGYSHALVMEPHTPCFFTQCKGLGICDGCGGNGQGDYGCGWSDKMWAEFVARFGNHRSRMLHVVPWHVPENKSVAHSKVALRSKSIVEQHACAAIPSHKGGWIPAAAKPTTNEFHQCFAICDDTTWPPSTCHSGSPTAVAYWALRRLTKLPRNATEEAEDAKAAGLNVAELAGGAQSDGTQSDASSSGDATTSISGTAAAGTRHGHRE